MKVKVRPRRSTSSSDPTPTSDFDMWGATDSWPTGVGVLRNPSSDLRASRTSFLHHPSPHRGHSEGTRNPPRSPRLYPAGKPSNSLGSPNHSICKVFFPTLVITGTPPTQLVTAHLANTVGFGFPDPYLPQHDNVNPLSIQRG
jgi:hypothetical protein